MVLFIEIRFSKTTFDRVSLKIKNNKHYPVEQ